MNKQLHKMLELAQPKPATPKQLMDCVMAIWVKEDRIVPQAPEANANANADADPPRDMYGNLYSNAKVKADAPGTAGVKHAAIALAIEYDDTLLRHGDVRATLDEWFEGLALFCMQPKVLFKDVRKQQECWDQRVRLCGNHCKPRSHSQPSVITYINALAAIYRAS